LVDDVVRLLRIRGRVQGVGYRAFVHEYATRLALSGWARNRSDGSVEVLVGGDRAIVDRLIAALRRGPPGARVAEIDQSDAAPDALANRGDAFAVLPTL
jgi:acylphosphatase